MHTCMVCGNKSKNTKVNRPGVIYHGIPKNSYMRRKWLKVFGIDQFHDWQRICGDHFLEGNYKPGKKRFLFSNAIPQPYDQNGFPSNYATQNNDIETGNNLILPIEQNMPDHTLGFGLRCSVKNCFNRFSKNLTFFGYPKDFTLRKKWIEKCGIKIDPSKIVMSSTRVCSTHFEIDCFKNIELKNRLKPSAIPSLFLDNAPNALPVSTDEVLSTCEDQFIRPIDNEAAEQSSEEKQYNVKDNSSMAIDLTIDDLSNDSLSITLEPIEKRTSQCIIMDVCNTEDLKIDEHGFIFEMTKEVKLPSSSWKSENLNSKNATRFYQRNIDGVTMKIVLFLNNLVPTIQIYGKKYEYTTPIKTKKELEDLLEKVDSIEKCCGRGGFVFKQCLGYFENSLVNMCSGCEGLVKDRDLQRMKSKLETINKSMESFDNRVSLMDYLKS
ncbi:unnamed protein product [Macrosiphum euphorbiae]|uniref:THAP-type domain-containing protein n=1 Tax=Macrosiphum euphorbiae TaxID=13131 RepID=A0AAV0XY24_9HEMI|nr:unnamed protein product [Macrosiphum euphorbiae]